MVDLHAIISEAGVEGIGLTKLKEKSSLKKADLDDQIKHLRAQHLIAGPFRTGKGNLFYAKEYQPNIDSAGIKIEGLVRHGGAKLLAKSKIEEEIKSPLNKFFKDAVRSLVATGRIAELKAGRSVYLLHIDAIRQLFPGIGTTDHIKQTGSSDPPLKEQVLHAYHELKAGQGGLSAVSIGKLLSQVDCSKETLHSFLLGEARAGKADLHPTTVLDLSPEDREGALSVPGKVEPAITVTFR